MTISAVVDTSAIIYLLADPDPTDARMVLNAKNTRLTFEWASEKKIELVVPAPVIAELGTTSSSSGVVLQSFVAHVTSRVRDVAFDRDAALVAGRVLALAHPSRQPGVNRSQMKFDAQIAAIAHQIGATYLITADMKPNSFPRFLKLLNSSTSIIKAQELPPGYQTRIDDLDP